MYGYIYKTINNINGKIYIGQHKSETFDEKYKGSGSQITEAFKKYGEDNFTTSLIEWCENSLLTDEREKYWINYYNSTNTEIGYNISKGGRINSFEGLKHSEESKAQMSMSHTGMVFSEEHKENISKAKRGCTYNEDRGKLISKALKARYEKQPRLVSPHKGHPLTQESRDLISQSKKGMVYSEESRKKMSESHTGKKHKPHKKHNYPKNRKSKIKDTI